MSYQKSANYCRHNLQSRTERGADRKIAELEADGHATYDKRLCRLCGRWAIAISNLYYIPDHKPDWSARKKRLKEQSQKEKK